MVAIPRILHLRFSLKVLLLIMTLVCVVLGHWVTTAKRQKEAVEAILRDGGHVQYDYSLAGATKPPEPKWLLDRLGVDAFHNVVTATGVSDQRPGDELYDFFKKQGTKGYQRSNPESVLADFPALTNLTFFTLNSSFERFAFLEKLDRLETLGVSYRGWTPGPPADSGGLLRLRSRTTLKELSIERIDPPADGLTFLEPLTNLESLSLSELRLQAGDFHILAALPKLQKLHLYRLRIDEETIAQIGELKNLREVDLTHTVLLVGGMRHLAELTSLRKLTLNGNVSSDDIQHLAGVKNLSLLDLRETSVGARELETLKQLTGVRELALPTFRITQEQVSELGKQLPNTRIRGGSSAPRRP